MINEKTIISQVSNNYGGNVSFNASAGTYVNKVLYKIGRLCVFSVVASMSGTSTSTHMATVPNACRPSEGRTNPACDRYGETSGAECYIDQTGKIYFANTQTGDFKISGVWVTAS